MHSTGLDEEKLLNMITEHEEITDRSLEQCTVKMFDKLTLPKLSDFIWAHDPNVLMKRDPKQQRKVRGCKVCSRA